MAKTTICSPVSAGTASIHTIQHEWRRDEEVEDIALRKTEGKTHQEDVIARRVINHLSK